MWCEGARGHHVECMVLRFPAFTPPRNLPRGVERATATQGLQKILSKESANTFAHAHTHCRTQYARAARFTVSTEASEPLRMMATGTDCVRWHLRHWARRIEVKREQAVCVNLSESPHAPIRPTERLINAQKVLLKSKRGRMISHTHTGFP